MILRPLRVRIADICAGQHANHQAVASDALWTVEGGCALGQPYESMFAGCVSRA